MTKYEEQIVWNISTSMDAWLGATANHGVILEGNWTDVNQGWVYHSDDATTGANRPFLLIDVPCTYGFPTVDEEFEFLGPTFGSADGVSFNPSQSLWESGDEVTMTWKLKTTDDDPGLYGEGQFLRMWIDLNSDCVFEESGVDSEIESEVDEPSLEEVPLLDDDGITEFPYVVENTSSAGNPSPCASVTPKNQVDTFQVTQENQIHTFTYKFTVPDLPFTGQITTKLRVYLRFGGWPPDDPTQDLVAESQTTFCNSEFGDFEDYDVTIRHP